MTYSFEHLPPAFRRALEQAESGPPLDDSDAEEARRDVVFAIRAFVSASATGFLVYDVQFRDGKVQAIGALYASELTPEGLNPLEPGRRIQMPRNVRVGSLADARREACPRCGTAGYFYCVEYADHKFDPDWHSDLQVLCLACPAVSMHTKDWDGFYHPASSSTFDREDPTSGDEQT